jgi:hypothetical protein
MMTMIDEAGDAADPMRGAARPDIAVADRGNCPLKTCVSDSLESDHDALALEFFHICHERSNIIRRIPRMGVNANQDVGARIGDSGGTIDTARLDAIRIFDESDSRISSRIIRDDLSSSIRAAAVSNEDVQDAQRLLMNELLEQRTNVTLLIQCRND